MQFNQQNGAVGDVINAFTPGFVEALEKAKIALGVLGIDHGRTNLDDTAVKYLINFLGGNPQS